MAKKAARKSGPPTPAPKPKSTKPRPGAPHKSKAKREPQAGKPLGTDAAVLAEALACLDAKTEQDNAKLRASPLFAGLVANGEAMKRLEAAQRAVEEETTPQREALERLEAEHPKGMIEGSEPYRQRKAFRAKIEAVRTRVMAEHKIHITVPPNTPGDFMARLRGIKLDSWFDFMDVGHIPRLTDTLWDDAERLRERNPFLPELPAQPDAGRARYAALIGWCEACFAQELAALVGAFGLFHRTLDATTVPGESGARRILGVPHAVALSEATAALYRALRITGTRLLQQHGKVAIGHPSGVVTMESDFPDGPWTPVPESDVHTVSMAIGGDGADAGLLAALESATKVAAFPSDKWNAMQAARPGGRHQRFHAGDVVSADQLATLDSAAKLLRIKVPSPANATASSEVSHDALERLADNAAARAAKAVMDREGSRGSGTKDKFHKPGGWTKRELLDEAGELAPISDTTFDNIRKLTDVKAAVRGGAGQQRRYSKADVRKLIVAADAKRFRHGTKIAAAWRGLLGE